MPRRTRTSDDPPEVDDADSGRPGPYDTAPDSGDAWFDPAPPEDAAPTDPPWPMAPPRRAAEADWPAMEAVLASALAQAALLVGALDDRLRQGPPGFRRRLVCAETADLSWHLGDRVTVDRLALYTALRLAGTSDDSRALARAAWAWRRLDRRGAVDTGDLAAFLGRGPEPDRDTDASAFSDRPTGAEFAALADAWRADLAGADGLHPFTRAAAAWSAWRRQGLSGDTAQIEGAVLAMRIGGEALPPGGIGFVPVALGGGAALLAGGSDADRLTAWYDGIARAARQGLAACDRLALWHRVASDRTADMSGRSPPRLIAALTDWPLASAPMLEAATGISRAAVQRNMTAFEDRALVHEVTGQSRFRFWRVSMAGAQATGG